jgi:hypothetical protein
MARQKPWPVRERLTAQQQQSIEKPRPEDLREASHEFANSATRAISSLRRIKRDAPGYLIQDMLHKLRGEG